MTLKKDVIREKLLLRKKDLEGELREFAENRTATDSDEVQDPIDQALKSSIEDLNITLEENQRDEYNRIVEALLMLDKGTYGLCADCRMPISERRLELYPNAMRCISCQENREQAA